MACRLSKLKVWPSRQPAHQKRWLTGEQAARRRGLAMPHVAEPAASPPETLAAGEQRG
jgi:hypothetical protein